MELALYNQGAAIPDYALPRLTERFYSLPRPASGRNSTALGLNFVQEVALLHGGELALRNVEGGVRASLLLPLPECLANAARRDRGSRPGRQRPAAMFQEPA